MTGYLLMVSLLFQSLSLFSQNSESGYILRARKAIFLLDTSSASRMIEWELAGNPDNGFACYYQNYLHFIETLLSGGEQEYKQYLKDAGNRLESLRSLDVQNPEYLYFLSSVYLQTSLLDFFNGDYWHGARSFYTAYRQIHENQVIYPDYQENKKILGIIELLLSSLPEDKEWLLDILGMSAERDAGMEKLHAYYMDCDPGNRLEALLIFSLASNYYASEPSEAFRELTKEISTGQESPLYQYVYALLAVKAGRPDDARGMLERYNAATDSYRIPFADLLMGTILLSDPEGNADFFLGRFIREYKGTNLKKTAYQKMSWYYFMEGNDTLYKEYRKLARSGGSNFLEQDKQAMAEAGDSSGLNPLLLRARILFDGKRCHEALDLLLEAAEDDLATTREQVEYHYRLARIYHALGNLQEAERNYLAVLDNGAACPCYFVPYSALQLAEIYEGAGDFTGAEKYYSACLKWNRYQYRSSIGSRARTGLNRVADHSKE